MAVKNLGKVVGADGKSAYQIWLDNGNTGTEQDFLDSLKGADGKEGVNGVDGKDGYTPVKGVDYFDGTNGVDGKDGYTPVKGKDYFDGQDGKDGANGQDGYTPVKGVDYFDGQDGVAGKDGTNGKDGVSVTHSWNGTILNVTSASGTTSVDLKGEKGDTGDTGSNGADGYTPVKGTDYWTEEDKEEIVTQTKELISLDEYVKSVNGTLPDETGNVTITVTAQQPEFVVKDTVEEALEWLRENGDTSKVYVLPNGYIYKYMTTEITYEKPNCNNLFVGDEAWLGHRISSANLVKVYDGRTLTNVIPVNSGETYDVRVYGLGGCEQIVEFSDIPTLVVEQVPTNFIKKTAGLSKTWEDPKASTCKFTHTMSSTTKYILLDTFATSEDQFANAIVTLNEPVVLGTTPVTEEVTDWTNTGQTYNSTDYEDRIIALEESSTEYDSRLTALESDTSYIPDYWQTHLNEKVPLIRTALGSAGRNKSSFLFYSDAHWNGNTKKSPMLLKYLYKYTPINKTVFGGDIVSTEGDFNTAMAYVYDEWRNAIRDLPNHHSVAGNHDDGNSTNNLLTEDEVYSYLLGPEETNDRVDGNGLYYYIDDKCEKTRYLYLDTACYGLTGENVKQDQLDFINSSLESTPNGWHIVAIAHAWTCNHYVTGGVDGHYYSKAAADILKIFNEFNTAQASTNRRVEFCIGGHLHNDLLNTPPDVPTELAYYTINWSNNTLVGPTNIGVNNNIPVILCEADTMHNRNHPQPQVGTIEEQCITAVIADYKSAKLKLIRIGRGEDMEVTLPLN